jgi:hypothetical protein
VKQDCVVPVPLDSYHPVQRICKYTKKLLTFLQPFPDIRNMVKNCARAGLDTSMTALVGIGHLSS